MKYLFFTTCTIVSLMTSLRVFAAAEVTEYPANNIKTVEVFNASGLVRAIGNSDAKATVAIDKIKHGDQCNVKIENKDSKLLVHVEQKSVASQACQINITVQIPKTSAVTIRNGAGNISAEDLQGSLEYAVGSGDVNIKGNLQKLDGSSGSGDTKFEGNTQTAQIKSGSGDVDVTYSQAPAKGELEIKTGSGDTTVSLPAQTKMSADTATGTGSILNELTSQKNAPFKVSIKSGTGDLNIRKF